MTVDASSADLKSAREAMRASLVTLKDVYGITGSFIFTRAGALVARELPLMFDDAALAEASSRLTRLQETFASAGDQLDVAVLRFRDHKLYVKTLSGGALCIISDGAVNMPALRMAASLVGRRISPALDTVAALPMLPPTAAPQPPAKPPLEVRAPVLAPPGMRRFRGRAVE
jgi:predicted regulator of Ras-like GTPase activity (Roadblock/LC7/MglB family)